MDRCRAPRRRMVVLDLEAVMGTVFLGMVFAIMWLSASLFAADIRNLHEEERRLARCPARVR